MQMLGCRHFRLWISARALGQTVKGRLQYLSFLQKSQFIFGHVAHCSQAPFYCASKVHLITFPPFSLGVGDLHSLHLHQISGTSILRRLRRRRKHQCFTEHKKLHNSPVFILVSAVVSLLFFFFSVRWVISTSFWIPPVQIPCFSP